MKAYVCDVCSKQAPFNKDDWRLPEGWYSLRNDLFNERQVCGYSCAQEQIVRFDLDAKKRREAQTDPLMVANHV